MLLDTLDVPSSHRFALLILLPYGPTAPLHRPRALTTAHTTAPLFVVRDALNRLNCQDDLCWLEVDPAYQRHRMPASAALFLVVPLSKAQTLLAEWSAANWAVIQRETAALSAPVA